MRSGGETSPATGEPRLGLDAARVAAELRAREPLSHREPRDAGRDHLEAMIAPGMVHIGASGTRTTREQYVAATVRRYERGDHGDDDAWVVEDFAVQEYAPHLWAATYVLRQGERVTERFTLWEWTGEFWRARRHQGTIVSP